MEEKEDRPKSSVGGDDHCFTSLITQVQLRGENYDEWARAMKTSFRARRKWSFIDGTIKKPEEGSFVMENWWAVQAMLVSWILNIVEPSL